MKSFTNQFLLDLVTNEDDDDETYAVTERLVDLFEQFMYGKISHDELIDYTKKSHRVSMLDELKTLLWENLDDPTL